MNDYSKRALNKLNKFAESLTVVPYQNHKLNASKITSQVGDQNYIHSWDPASSGWSYLPNPYKEISDLYFVIKPSDGLFSYDTASTTHEFKCNNEYKVIKVYKLWLEYLEKRAAALAKRKRKENCVINGIGVNKVQKALDKIEKTHHYTITHKKSDQTIYIRKGEYNDVAALKYRKTKLKIDIDDFIDKLPHIIDYYENVKLKKTRYVKVSFER